jgi:hypothetical protein
LASILARHYYFNKDTKESAFGKFCLKSCDQPRLRRAHLKPQLLQVGT